MTSRHYNFAKRSPNGSDRREPLMTVTEFSRRVNVSASSLGGHLSNPKTNPPKPVLIASGYPRYSLSELKSWFNSLTTTGAST